MEISRRYGVFTSWFKQEKAVIFEIEDTDRLIDFYREIDSLLNHHLVDYRERSLREALLNKLVDEFEGKFTVQEIKQQ